MIVFRLAMLIGLLLGSLKGDDGNGFLIVTDVLIACYLASALAGKAP